MNDASAGQAEPLFATLRQAADEAVAAAIEAAVAAALRMRDEMERLNRERGSDDLHLKIGIHEGPCLAVVLNDHQDYFGSTVNIASRVQGLAESRAIFVSEPIVRSEPTASLLAARGLTPVPQQRALRGLADAYAVFEIP